MDDLSDEQAKKNGAKTKLFGVVLIFLGVLDSMLSWRGGFELSRFYIVLMVAGAAFYFIGSIMQNRKTSR
jgi:hypothetical protein